MLGQHHLRAGTQARGARRRLAPAGAGWCRETERAALRIAADRPAIARMHDGAAELGDALQRGGHVRDREVGQRERVAGTTSARVNADVGLHPRGSASPRLLSSWRFESGPQDA